MQNDIGLKKECQLNLIIIVILKNNIFIKIYVVLKFFIGRVYLYGKLMFLISYNLCILNGQENQYLQNSDMVYGFYVKFSI